MSVLHTVVYIRPSAFIAIYPDVDSFCRATTRNPTGIRKNTVEGDSESSIPWINPASLTARNKPDRHSRRVLTLLTCGSERNESLQKFTRDIASATFTRTMTTQWLSSYHRARSIHVLFFLIFFLNWVYSTSLYVRVSYGMEKDITAHALSHTHPYHKFLCIQIKIDWL